MTTTNPADDPLWTAEEFASYVGGKFTAAAAAQMRHRGTGPRYIRVGKRSIRYRRSDVLAWIDANVETQTPGAA